MGIKGIENQLVEYGKIKIGKKGAEITSASGTKFRPPEKFKHFVLTTTERDEAGDLIVDQELMDRIEAEESGMFNDDEKLIGVPIRLLYDSIKANFSNRLESYEPAGRTCFGDNEKSFKRITDFDPEKPTKCPCQRIEPGYTGKDKCKFVGKLTCIIDEAELLGQVHTFRTTSRNSVLGILGGLNLIRTFTRGKLAGIPLMLTFNQKATKTATGISTTIPVVTVCFRGSQHELRRRTLQIMSEESQFLLSMADMEPAGGLFEIDMSPDEEKEIQEEFYPDTVVLSQNSSAGENAKKVENAPEEGTNTVIETTENTSREKSTNGVKEEPEQIGNNVETDLSETVVISAEDLKKAKIQAELVDRLNEESDPKKAFALTKRLTSPTLIAWIKSKYVDTGLLDETDLPPEIGKKPLWVALTERLIYQHGTKIDKEKPENSGANIEDEFSEEKIAARVKSCNGDKNKIMLTGFKDRQLLINYLKNAFPDTPIDATRDFDGTFDLGCRLIDKHGGWAKVDDKEKVEEINKQDDPIINNKDFPAEDVYSDPEFKWAPGEPIAIEQQRAMARIKGERQIGTEEWENMVRQYTDKDGLPITTARNFTARQSDHFLFNLEETPF